MNSLSVLRYTTYPLEITPMKKKKKKNEFRSSSKALERQYFPRLQKERGKSDAAAKQTSLAPVPRYHIERCTKLIRYGVYSSVQATRVHMYFPDSSNPGSRGPVGDRMPKSGENMVRIQGRHAGENFALDPNLGLPGWRILLRCSVAAVRLGRGRILPGWIHHGLEL